jgi:hypothetical protein
MGEPPLRNFTINFGPQHAIIPHSAGTKVKLRVLLVQRTSICPRAAQKQRRVEVAILPSAALMPSAGI